MATLITAIEFTRPGIKGIDDTIKRAAGLKRQGRRQFIESTSERLRKEAEE